MLVGTSVGRPVAAFVTHPHLARQSLVSSSLSVSIPLADYTNAPREEEDRSSGVTPLTPGSAAFPKIGILLLNLGGPETLDDVEGR